jgi:hypothetical protein
MRGSVCCAYVCDSNGRPIFVSLTVCVVGVWSVCVGFGRCVYRTNDPRNAVVQTHNTHTSAASETSQSVAFAGQAESRITNSRGSTFCRPSKTVNDARLLRAPCFFLCSSPNSPATGQKSDAENRYRVGQSNRNSPQSVAHVTDHFRFKRGGPELAVAAATSDSRVECRRAHRRLWGMLPG